MIDGKLRRFTTSSNVFILSTANRILKSFTWYKDSNNLFNYESSEILREQFKLLGNSKIIRTGMTVRVVGVNKQPDNTHARELARLALHKDNYWVYSIPGANSEPLFVALRGYCGDSGMPGMRIVQGDVFRLGRCSFVVRELVNGCVHTQEVSSMMKEEHKVTVNEIDVDLVLNLDDNIDKKQVHIISDIKDQEGIPEENESMGISESKGSSVKLASARSTEIKCRICLGDDNEDENPIIESPCKCLGSVKYIHANCLQHWLKSKITEQKNEFCLFYRWKEFECDVCKEKYPGNCGFNFRVHCMP